MRGDFDLGRAPFYLTGGDAELVDALTDALMQHGATIADSAKGATAIALQSGFNRAALTTDARGRANAHEIRYTVEFTVAAADKESTAHNLTLTRALNYDSTKQLQSELETRFLESAMRQEAATRIMQVLSRR